jgi:LuxR family maltose regulon positive regulatory protein
VPRSILYAKLNRPRSSVKTLARARLSEQIDHSLASNVTTIVAPAGFGKTVLLASWMAQHSSPVAWLSLDANDNQLLTFVRYLTLALEMLFPQGCRETRSLVEALFPPTLTQLTDCLLAEIGDLPERTILILDDYQVVENPQIHALVTSLIDHLSKNLHLIMPPGANRSCLYPAGG